MDNKVSDTIWECDRLVMAICDIAMLGECDEHGVTDGHEWVAINELAKKTHELLQSVKD